jgi:hypothetical protein
MNGELKTVNIRFSKASKTYARGDTTNIVGLNLSYDSSNILVRGIKKVDNKGSAGYIDIPASEALRVGYAFINIAQTMKDSDYQYACYLVVKYDKLTLWQRIKFFKMGYSTRNNKVGVMMFNYTKEKFDKIMSDIKAIAPDYSDIVANLMFKKNEH